MGNMTSSNAMADAITAIGAIDNVGDLKVVSGELNRRWRVLSRISAAQAAAQFAIGDKVLIKRRGLVGVITKFGPKNVLVSVDMGGIPQVWRCHPTLIEKVNK